MCCVLRGDVQTVFIPQSPPTFAWQIDNFSGFPQFVSRCFAASDCLKLWEWTRKLVSRISGMGNLAKLYAPTVLKVNLLHISVWMECFRVFHLAVSERLVRCLQIKGYLPAREFSMVSPAWAPAILDLPELRPNCNVRMVPCKVWSRIAQVHFVPSKELQSNQVLTQRNAWARALQKAAAWNVNVDIQQLGIQLSLVNPMGAFVQRTSVAFQKLVAISLQCPASLPALLVIFALAFSLDRLVLHSARSVGKLKAMPAYSFVTMWMMHTLKALCNFFSKTVVTCQLPWHNPRPAPLWYVLTGCRAWRVSATTVKAKPPVRPVKLVHKWVTLQIRVQLLWRANQMDNL